ncbi:MAG: C45 family peptidase [Cyclobacteriaceae bacterium]
MIVSFNCINEQQPDEKWVGLFEKTWPFYKKWFLSEGMTARQGYLTSSSKLEQYMPEIFPIYEKLTSLAGGGDLESRFLSMYCPPPYMSGCSQLAWTKSSVALMRNYDYNPKMFEGVMLYSNWLKPVIGISDCTWGLLDGMNADGLAVSLTFGGSKKMGTGFGIPVILRYALETCSTVKEAQAVFCRIPVHMAYNVSMVDPAGHYSTMYLTPNQPARIVDTHVGTNHQGEIVWNEYAELTETVKRKEFIEEHYANEDETVDSMLRKFLKPPLYSLKFEKSFGTLYTVNYNSSNRTVHVMWPTKTLNQSFENFVEEKVLVNLKLNVHSKLSM